MLKKFAVFILCIISSSLLLAQQSANLGIFDATADWGLEPEFPPQLGAFKIPGRVEVSEVDGDYVYDIYGIGDEIFFDIDEGFFVYTERTGSWSLSAKLEWIDIGVELYDEKPSPKIGIMIRELSADAKWLFYSYLSPFPLKSDLRPS